MTHVLKKTFVPFVVKYFNLNIKTMKIIIAAGTGFLGKNLEQFLTEKGNEVYILTRNPKRKNEIFWDAKSLGDWKESLENADVLINLAGKSVDCRYSGLAIGNSFHILRNRNRIITEKPKCLPRKTHSKWFRVYLSDCRDYFSEFNKINFTLNPNKIVCIENHFTLSPNRVVCIQIRCTFN